MLFWSIGIGAIAVFLFFFLFGYVCFRHAHRRRKRYPADKKPHGGGYALPPEGQALLAQSRAWFDSQTFEAAAVRSEDGLRLCGRLLPAENARGIVILFHGYHSSCRRDLSVQAMLLHRAGYHLLLTDQRAHGESEGRYICFGAKERADVAPWCCLAQRRFGALPIALFGLSMGSSTVLMSASRELPAQVCCIVGDCGFHTPWAIIRRTLYRRNKIPPFPVIYFMNYWSRLLAGFDYREYSSSDLLRAGKSLPVLLIHGTADDYVPPEMSEQIAASVGQAELYLVPDARHGQSVYYAPREYEETVLRFLSRHMPS